MYERMLLAYDGTLEGAGALPEGAMLAKRVGAKVFIPSFPKVAASVSPRGCTRPQ